MYIAMKITISKAFMLLNGMGPLMKNGNLSTKTKFDLVTLSDELEILLKPFMTLRAEVVAKHTDDKGVMDKIAINDSLKEVIEEEKELKIEKFELNTSKDDRTITAETLLIFKKVFGDEFKLL